MRRDGMKSETGKTRKQGQMSSPKNKSACGTLSYIAECRGMKQKKEISRWTAPPDGMNTIVRKYPAAS
jgi:hypothetical protein